MRLHASEYPSATATIDGQIAEIDENIERREITAVERADLIARRVELLEARRRVGDDGQSAQVAPIEKSKRADGKGHRPESGVRQTARELGMPRDKVRRSLAIASLSPEAKAKAVDLGMSGGCHALAGGCHASVRLRRARARSILPPIPDPRGSA